MGRLEDVRVIDPVLTSIARGYNNAQAIAGALFPFAKVQKEAGKVIQFTKESFKIYNTERAIRASSNRMIPESNSSLAYVLDEHDLEYPIDYREYQEAEGTLQISMETYAVNTVQSAIMLRREKAASDLMAASGNYVSGHVVTLSGTSKWSAQSTSDPLGDLESGIDVIRTAIGVKPNTLVLGYSAYVQLRRHPQLSEKIKYSMKDIITPDLIAQIVGIPNVVIGEAVYASDANVFSDLWGANAYLAYVGTGQDVYEPSFGYTLRKISMPVSDMYLEKGGKVLLVRNTDIFLVKALGWEAAYGILNVK